jgi:hypothetical protein
VGRGDGWRKKVQHRQPAQNSLNDHSGHRAQRQSAHPASLVHAPCPDGNNDRQQPHKLGNHAVRVLKLYPADHLGDFEQMAEARRPVRDGQAGIVAGDQPAGNDQQQSQRGNKYSKAMVGGVIRGRGQNYSLKQY